MAIVRTDIPMTSELCEQTIQKLAEAYPFLKATVLTTTAFGRPLYAVKIGDGDRQVIFSAAHHANEWITTPLLLKFTEELAEAFQKGASKLYYEMFNLPPDCASAEEVPTFETKKTVKTQIEERQAQNLEKDFIKKASINAVIYKNHNLNDVVYTVLLCLSHISEKKYYGVTILTDVLRGASSKRIMEAELNKIPEYGKLQKMHREDLIVVVDWMIENHFILKTKHPKYPVLHPTYEGMHYDEIITETMLKKLFEKLNTQ